MRDPAQPFEVRRDALKFIVHFMGDVHQPLHSSNRPDKGANDFQVSLRTDIPPEEYARERYKDGIMGTNLHAVWDYYVLASAKLPLDEYANKLAASSRLTESPTQAGSVGQGVLQADRSACDLPAIPRHGRNVPERNASAGRATRRAGGGSPGAAAQ